MEDQTMAILKALSDPNRIRIIELLLHNDFCVGALAVRLNISEAAVSQHLKVLRTVGIVSGEKIGYYTHYEVNTEPIRRVTNELKPLYEMNHTREGCRLRMTGDHENCKRYLREQRKKGVVK